MLFFCPTINQDIVEVYRIELIEIFIESIVNKPLECSRGSYQPKQYNKGFEESKVGKEGSQVLVAFLYLYVIKHRDNINLCKVFHPFEVI